MGFILEGDPDGVDGRRVDSKPASGGVSASRIDADGNFRVELSGSLERGDSAEWHVLKVLMKAIEATGKGVENIGGANDDYGQDAIIGIDGRRTEVQMTSIPRNVWERLSRGETVIVEGSLEKAVSLVRDGISRKATSAKGMLLALDASQVGVIVNRKTAHRYLELYGDPCAEFGFKEVWLVGPTVRSTIRL